VIIDLADSGPELDVEADLCIVGAGAAGLTIVHELRRSAVRVCVIETGGLAASPAADRLNELGDDGAETAEPLNIRPRIFGGSTAEWGGMCCPLDPCDFEPRPTMALHRWPLALRELQPYYERAHAALGLGVGYFDERVWSHLGVEAPAMDPALVQTKFWQFRFPNALPPDSPLRFGPAYLSDFGVGANATAVLNATVVGIDRLPGTARVERLRFLGLNGRSGQVRATVVVLAAGTVENTRLLLNSEFRRASPALGRYFMEHPHVPVGLLSYRDLARLLPGWAVLQRLGRVAVRPKFLPTPAYQRERDILNASIALEMRCGPDCPHRALGDLTRAIRAREAPAIARAAGRVLVSPRRAGATVYRKSRGRPGCRGHGGIVLYSRSEQEPNPESRIELGPERDVLGVPKATVSWRLTDRDRRTVVDFAGLVGEQLRRLGAVGPTRPEWLVEPQGWSELLRGGPHHSGTTRMSDSPATGVVDRNSRVHGADNLYVVGPAVFPTGGYANPMYTTVALALRAADELRRRLEEYRSIGSLETISERRVGQSSTLA
jgi:choline dehydrogenase-like flavoprotein